MPDRYLGLALDPVAGGSGYDDLLAAGTGGNLQIPSPTVWWPITNAEAEGGYEDADRNDEVLNRRGTPAPVPHRAAPTAQFSVRGYPRIARALLLATLGVKGADTGVAPAAVQTPLSPLPWRGVPPTFVLWLVREDQVDVVTGAAVDQMEVDLSGESMTLQPQLKGLYHQAMQLPGNLPSPSGFDKLGQPYPGVTLTAKTGAALTAIDCVAGAQFTINNNLSDDDDVVYCRGKNVRTLLANNQYRRRQYPTRHRVGRNQVTGQLQFGNPRQDFEQRRAFVQAEQLQLDVTGDPLGTTPAADDLLRVAMPQHALTGGGASELQQDQELKASYDFAGHIDPATGQDITVSTVSKSAYTLADLLTVPAA